MICEYGCGQKAHYQFKNGKWCCSEKYQSCSKLRIKNSKSNKGRSKPISNKTKNKIRDLAIIRYKNKEFKNKFKNSLKDRKIKKVRIEVSNIKCSYGCNEFARYYFPTVKKWCCSSHYLKCKQKQKEIINLKIPSKINTNKLCDYGCGNRGNYIFTSSKKICCSKNWSQCPNVRKKNSKTNQIKQKGENNARYGIKLSESTKQKIRIGYINDMKNKYGQLFPNYNKQACKLINEYGKMHGYNFQHAENGGEFFIKELGYWVDGYDSEKNVVIEVDESHHFDENGNLIKKDLIRQQQIIGLLNCKFIRIRNRKEFINEK